MTTRRQFIALCTGGLAVAGLGVLAACQAAPPTPGQGPTSASSGSSSSAAPRRGGTLTWALWDKIDDIDPATPTGASALEVINNIVDPLITMDADQKFYPALATKWTVEDDARKFTFTLRDDVKFHDGVALDSSAVKRTLDRILDPPPRPPASWRFWVRSPRSTHRTHARSWST